MSKKKTTPTVTTQTAKDVESEYTVQELAQSGVFGNISPDIVTAALKTAGVHSTITVRAAETIIKKFMTKEV